MLTPTRAVQSFIDCKKDHLDVPETVLETIRSFRKWNEIELLGLKNASAYFPDIYFQEGMEQEITTLIQKFHGRQVPHQF